MTSPRSAFVSFALLFCALFLLGRAARAHTVPGSITLSERVLLADVVVIAAISKPSVADDSPGRQRGRLLAEATVSERLRGELPPGALRFELHSHSGDTYAAGETVILFLQKSDSPGGLYRTVDDVSDHVSLATPSSERPARAQVVAAVRAYARALAAGDEAARAAQRKEATLALLRVPDTKLQTSALRDLSQGAVALGPADVPPLLAIADDPRVSMAVRVTLLEDLLQKGLANPVTRYEAWLKVATLTEMEPLARAAGAKNDPSITEALAGRLGDASEEIAANAARALGEPFHESAVPALVRAADPGRRKLAAAAVEGLGRMGTTAAQQALSDLLRKSDDPAWQRLVQAQINRIAQRAPAPAASMASPDSGAAAPAPGATENARTNPLWKVAAVVVAALAVAVALRRARARRRLPP